MMLAEDEAQAKRKKKQEEEWERYRRREDARQVEQALPTSQKRLADIIDSWGRAMVVERFFAHAEARLEGAEEERKQRLKERLALARQMMGSIDPLDLSTTGKHLKIDLARNMIDKGKNWRLKLLIADRTHPCVLFLDHDLRLLRI